MAKKTTTDKAKTHSSATVKKSLKATSKKGSLKKSQKAKKAVKETKEAKPTVEKKPSSCTFVAYIKTSPVDSNHRSNEITVTVEKDEEHMLWDDVECAVFDVMEKMFPMEYYPKAEVHEVFILDHDDKAKRYPVVRENDEEAIRGLEKSREYEKFLVLPEATYSLSPEYRLFLELNDLGLIKDGTEFDIEKMRKLLETASLEKTED